MKPSQKRLKDEIRQIQQATGRSPKTLHTSRGKQQLRYKRCSGCGGRARSPLDGISPDGIPAPCSWCGGTGKQWTP